jgi:uncharacterized protein YecE (DUF72 family)
MENNMKHQSSSPENPQVNIGCAGWSIPRAVDDRFPVEGSHLERYSRVFNAVEINSSFYRPHKPLTYERWKNSVPDSFRFAVKVPKLITHSLRLRNSSEALAAFLGECTNLGTKLDVLLVQLPPALPFHSLTAESFFETLRTQFEGDVALEPRHATWFTPEVAALLSSRRIARVAADPALTPEASSPGGWAELVYYRLHGSPRTYYSGYSSEYLGKLAHKLTRAGARGSRTWCIFDNTAEGAATGNALDVMEMLRNEECAKRN